MKRTLCILLLAAGMAFAAEGGHGEDHGPSPVWKWANFLILAGLLGYGISKAAPAFFRGRTLEIQKAIREAHKLRDEAEARAAEIDRRMANLEAEIKELRENSAREMAAESDRIQAETARLTARMRENAENEIAAAANQAAKELRAYSSELALEVAQEKIRSRLSPDVQGQLVDAFVSMLRKPRGPVN